MSLFAVCILFSLLWTMCVLSILIETKSTSYQFYEPTPIQEKESQPFIRNLVVTEEEFIQPIPSNVPKNTLLQYKLQNEKNIKVLEKDNDELHTLRNQLRMIHKQLRVMERNYHHMEKNRNKSAQENNTDVSKEINDSTKKVKKIQKQYQELRESFFYTQKRFNNLKKNKVN